MDIKIMEWNINQRLNWSESDMPYWIADVIAEESADIVALTEVYKGNNWEDIKKRAFGCNYVVFETFNASAGQNDIAIAINSDKFNAIYEKAYYPSTSGVPDNLVVKLRTRDANIEFLFSCIRIHALVSDETKCQELQRILDISNNENKAIICGDFNNYRRGCPQRKWYLSAIEKMCNGKQFVVYTPEGSSIYEENQGNIPYQFPEDHFLLKGINDNEFDLLPYNREFVIKDNTVYKWGKDFQKYLGKGSDGKNKYESISPPYPDHAILEGILKI